VVSFTAGLLYPWEIGPGTDWLGNWVCPRAWNRTPVIQSVAQNIIRVITLRRMSWTGHVARAGETRNAYIILVEKSVGRREDNFEVYLEEVRPEVMDWIHLAQNQGQ
jgi:hypothetical protein